MLSNARLAADLALSRVELDAAGFFRLFPSYINHNVYYNKIIMISSLLIYEFHNYKYSNNIWYIPGVTKLFDSRYSISVAYLLASPKYFSSLILTSRAYFCPTRNSARKLFILLTVNQGYCALNVEQRFFTLCILWPGVLYILEFRMYDMTRSWSPLLIPIGLDVSLLSCNLVIWLVGSVGLTNLIAFSAQ